MDIGELIEYTADDLKKRHEDYLIACKKALKEKDEKLKKLCKTYLKQLIAEFNRKAQNEFDKTYVFLKDTPIPPSLPLNKVVELIRESFSDKGFEVTLEVLHNKSFIKVSWEN